MSLSAWRAELRALLVLATPLAASHLAQMAIGLTDTMMLGRFSREALAASVLGNTVYLFGWLIGLGPTAAVAPMIAQARGADVGDRSMVREVARMGLWAAALMSAPLAAMLLATRPILEALGQDPALADAAARFARPLALGLPFALGFQVLRNFAVALGRPQPTLWVTLLMLGINFGTDWVLIFGRFGAPRLGLVGSGLATAATLCIGFLVMAAAIALTPELHAVRISRRLLRPCWSRLREIFVLGLPVGLMQVLESGFYLAVHLIVGTFGPLYVAAHAIAWNVQTLTSLVPTGLGMAATVRVGLAAGADDPRAVRQAGLTALLTTVVVMSGLGALVAACARPIASLYMAAGPQTAAVVTIAVPFLLIAAGYQVVDGLQATAAFALRGIKDVHTPALIMAASFWALGLPACLALAFPLGLGPLGVWIGMAAALTAAALLLTYRFIRLTAG